MCHQVEFSSVLNLHEIGLSCSPSAVPSHWLESPYISYRSKETRVACHNNSEGNKYLHNLGQICQHLYPTNSLVSHKTDAWFFVISNVLVGWNSPIVCLVQAFLRNEMELMRQRRPRPLSPKETPLVILISQKMRNSSRGFEVPQDERLYIVLLRLFRQLSGFSSSAFALSLSLSLSFPYLVFISPRRDETHILSAHL